MIRSGAGALRGVGCLLASMTLACATSAEANVVVGTNTVSVRIDTARQPDLSHLAPFDHPYRIEPASLAALLGGLHYERARSIGFISLLDTDEPREVFDADVTAELAAALREGLAAAAPGEVVRFRTYPRRRAGGFDFADAPRERTEGVAFIRGGTLTLRLSDVRNPTRPLERARTLPEWTLVAEAPVRAVASDARRPGVHDEIAVDIDDLGVFGQLAAADAPAAGREPKASPVTEGDAEVQAERLRGLRAMHAEGLIDADDYTAKSTEILAAIDEALADADIRAALRVWKALDDDGLLPDGMYAQKKRRLLEAY